MHHMKRTGGGSIVLLASTSGYFGGTGVTAYIASKHGVVGLLRAVQTTARLYDIRINAIAPFLTPTHITAGFAQQWLDAGLEANTPEKVAEAIAKVALDEGRRGSCVLVSYLLVGMHLWSFFCADDYRLRGSIGGKWKRLGLPCCRLGWGRMLLRL